MHSHDKLCTRMITVYILYRIYHDSELRVQRPQGHALANFSLIQFFN